MSDLGFWRQATAEPDRIVLIDPEGGEHGAGELLGNANRLVHALRAIGLGPGDTVAAVLPNGVAMLETYLAALQAGWYLTPINHHLVAPEVAYILRDSDAKAFIS